MDRFLPDEYDARIRLTGGHEDAGFKTHVGHFTIAIDCFVANEAKRQATRLVQ